MVGQTGGAQLVEALLPQIEGVLGQADERGDVTGRQTAAPPGVEDEQALVEGELADPRIGLVGVTAVHMADDGRSAQVLVDVDGDDREAERSLEGLLAAKEFIRHELVERLRLRRAPELHFRLDRSEREKARVEELLARAKKRMKQSAKPGKEKA